MRKILNMFTTTRFGSKKILYIIALTSIFWFSLNVLLLIANNEAALNSLDSLSLGLGNHRAKRDSHFMGDTAIKPLAPANNKHYPWKDNWPAGKGVVTQDHLDGRKKIHEVYDISAKRNRNPGLGENGDAAYLVSEEDKKLSEKLFANHSFNSILSDKISLDRTLKDVRGDK